MAARPSGAATIVSAPFSSTTAPVRLAAALAADSRSGDGIAENPGKLPRMRRQHGSAPQPVRIAGERRKHVRVRRPQFVPPRSGREGRARASAAPRPGPQTQTTRRLSANSVGRSASLTSRPGSPPRYTEADPRAAIVTMPAPARRAASAARREAPVISAPPTTVTCPRVYLCASLVSVGSRHSAGQVGEGVRLDRRQHAVRDADVGQLDLDRTGPGQEAEGGLASGGRRSPSSRLERHGREPVRWRRPAPREHRQRRSAAPPAASRPPTPVTGRASPAPKTASTTRSARAASAAVNGTIGPCHRRAAPAASEPSRGGPSAARHTGQPSCRSSRATT